MTPASKYLVAMAAIALTWPLASTRAQTPETGYTLPSTQAFDLKSDSGETYRIFVSYPSATPPVKSWPGAEIPADGWPVLYVLDGNAMFAGFAEARRMQERSDIGRSIVVGVGYPGDEAYDVRRLDDYTPPLLDPPPQQWRGLARYKSGGREKFLDFLTGRLRTEIGRRFRINSERQSLFGHSLGGLFGLYTLYTRPQAFQSIVVASPSLEWNDQGVLTEERAFAARLTSGKPVRTSRLMVVVGDRDIDDAPDPAEALVKRMEHLSGYGLRTRYRRYADEGHMTVPARAVTDTLRFAFEAR